VDIFSFKEAGMKRIVLIAVLSAFFVFPLLGQQAEGFKVLISVDMEGITGVVSADECNRGASDDYKYFRRIMTHEAGAAVEGALAAGATEIVVRDAHGSGRNILPDLLHKSARLLRDWSFGPKEMMEGIDESFGAAVLIGYQASAGRPNAVLEHTWSGRITDLKINGVTLPEAGLNALIAGHFNVPVVFVSGDQAVCDQVRGLLGEIESAAVKQGIGAAALSLHPEVAGKLIREGVERGLRNRGKYKPFRMAPPYKLILTLKDEKMVDNGQYYPGAKRTGDWELTFEGQDLMEVLKSFSGMQKQ
jgi:D-amino peptidase